MFRSWQEWRDEAAATPPFLIDGLIHSSSTIVSGRPASGKTTIAAAMAAVIAGDATTFWGRKVNAHGTVVVVCTDGGEPSAWGRRMAHHNPEHEVLIAYFDRRTTWNDLHSLLDQVEPALFIFDNVLGALTDDVRSNAAARILLDQFDRVARRGVPVMALHHSSLRQWEDGAFSKGPMGSTAFDAWDRLTVHVEKVGPNSLKVTSQGNESPTCDLLVDMEMGVDLDASLTLLGSNEVRDKRTRGAETRQRRRDFVRDHIIGNEELRGVISQRGIADALNLNLSKVQRGLKEMPAVYDPATELWVPAQSADSLIPPSHTFTPVNHYR